MFRYKKYGLAAGGLMKTPKAEEASRESDLRPLPIGIDTQANETLPQMVDLHGRSILRRALAIFGEFCAPKSGIAFFGEFGDLVRRRASVDRCGWRRRGLQKPIDPFGTGPNAELSLKRGADRRATRPSVGKPQRLDHGIDGRVSDVLRSRHKECSTRIDEAFRTRITR